MENIRKELKISRHYQIDKELINSCIEQETIPKGYWSFKQQLTTNEDALKLVKW